MGQQLRAVVQENTWLDRGVSQFLDYGWGNGYVLIPEGHPLHGVDYNNIGIDAHGGLSYSGKVTQANLEKMDELTEDDIGMWLIGFDTGHYQDSLIRWPEEAVRAEAEALKARIQAGDWSLMASDDEEPDSNTAETAAE